MRICVGLNLTAEMKGYSGRRIGGRWITVVILFLTMHNSQVKVNVHHPCRGHVDTDVYSMHPLSCWIISHECGAGYLSFKAASAIAVTNVLPG
jgi:hypothetical protein